MLELPIRLTIGQSSGQPYKHSTLVIYDTRLVLNRKILTIHLYSRKLGAYERSCKYFSSQYDSRVVKNKYKVFIVLTTGANPKFTNTSF